MSTRHLTLPDEKGHSIEEKRIFVAGPFAADGSANAASSLASHVLLKERGEAVRRSNSQRDKQVPGLWTERYCWCGRAGWGVLL